MVSYLKFSIQLSGTAWELLNIRPENGVRGRVSVSLQRPVVDPKNGSWKV